MEPFTCRVIAVIQSIPPGHVMTYGQIASAAGSPRAARQVVRVLHSSSRKHGLPWHRVVNAKGEIALQDEASRLLQAALLQDEGVIVEDGRVDLNLSRFCPDPDWVYLEVDGLKEL